MPSKPKLLNNVKFLQKCIIVNSEGKVLALLRQPNDLRRPNAWDFPGGNYEVGEDVNEALKREVQEETSIDVINMHPVYLSSGMGQGYRNITVFALTQVCDLWKGKVNLSSEHVDYRWVTPDEFFELETGDDGGFLKDSLRTYIALPYHA